MKLNKSFIVSFSGLMIAPILGVLISIFQLNKKMQSIVF
jgi:type III secretory pathway component EscS